MKCRVIALALLFGAVVYLAAGPVDAQSPQVVQPQQQQQLSPKEVADEAIIVQMETNYRDAYAQAIGLDAQAKALVKQNQDLTARLTESEKKQNEALAELAELKGRGKAPQTPMPPK